MAEPGAPDTGLPIAEPFPRDLEPEGGPIGPTSDPAPTDPETAGVVGAEAVVAPRTGPADQVAGHGSGGDRPRVLRGAGLAEQDPGADPDPGAADAARSASAAGGGAGGAVDADIRRGEPAASVTAAPRETARGDAPRAGAGADDDASLGAAQPVGLDEGLAASAVAVPGPPPTGTPGAPARASATGAALAGSLPGSGGTACAPGYPIKAEAGSMRYRQPDDAGYARVVPDRCFRSAEAAEAAGYARAEREE